jgi:hypothetical protein
LTTGRTRGSFFVPTVTPDSPPVIASRASGLAANTTNRSRKAIVAIISQRTRGTVLPMPGIRGRRTRSGGTASPAPGAPGRPCWRGIRTRVTRRPSR